jgi:toxin HigB-1
MQSFRDQAAADLFRDRNTRAARRIPQALWRGAQRKLKLLDAAGKLDDLVVPAGNRREALKGDRVGRHSTRVNDLNDQSRMTFRWESLFTPESCCSRST